MQSTRKLVALLVIALAVLALGPASAVRAGSGKPQVYPPQAHPFGHSYGEWEVRFYQWWAAIPATQNPLTDVTGEYCALGQSGPVWYLVINSGSGSVVRTCTVPAGKALFVAASGAAECSTAEGNGDTFETLRSCAKGYIDQVTEATVTVDGIRFTNLLTRYRFSTPLFSLKYPADNVLGPPPPAGPGTTKSVGDGIFLMLAPLAAGQHTIEIRGVAPAFSWDGKVTYRLTIRR